MEIKRKLVATLSTSALMVGGLSLATVEPASAASTWKLKATCSAVKIRAKAKTSSSVRGVAYRKDLMRATKVDHKGYDDIKVNKAWIYGKLTRKSDGKTITGWAALKCFNPYEQ